MSDKVAKRRSNAPTLQDIANEAGVSAMAVSVVLNRAVSSTRVSEATRVRILDAAKKLRYRPNAVARGLQRRRMDTIGVVAVVDSADVNVYFLELLNGVLKGADDCSQNMTIFSIHAWERDQLKVANSCDGRVDGMILLGPHPTPRLIELLPAHTPVVSIHSSIDFPGVANLSTDGEAGAYELIRYLISQGHRRIMHITGPLETGDAEARLLGYKRALKDGRIEFDPDLVLPGNYIYRSGREEIPRWLNNHVGQELPTAIFGANDATAVGAIDALSAAGYAVPREISVVGFDDSLVALMTNPPLTTVRQPLREMGRRAVSILMRQIETHALQPSEVFPTELIVRNSVAPPRKESIKIAKFPEVASGAHVHEGT